MSASALVRLILGCAVLAAVFLPSAVELTTSGHEYDLVVAPAVPSTTAVAPAPPVVVPLPPPVAVVEQPGRPGF
ncbi:MAG: hypothetical protein QF903_03440 [Planctomycetota bacterium]|nr:hypothetical protein [Planctomycetota bacterium]MDP6764108.1 hypothetical protein [Planctomycetota bacterium]MDP6988510.1 hypothetical protein [Planctomycetota bacterium]